MQATIWLRSKTTIPQPMDETVERQRLNNLLQEDFSKKLTILCAPAGYGKTTTLSQWLHQTDTTIAWLSIDQADNDPIRFWQYIIRNVSEVTQTTINKELASLFASQDPSSFEFLVDSFIYELSLVNQKISLILDDYHLIKNETIHSMMTQFIEFLPNNVHVYITTRSKLLYLPIAKWRTKPWYREIDMELLRFTYEEVQQFYEKKKRFFTDPSILHNIMSKTEGWIAGIQLTELSTRNSPLSDTNFGGITGTNPYIFDYLLHDVLMTLPDDLQDFMLRTSFLESLDPEICNSLTKRTDSLNILLELEKIGLFIVRLNAEHTVFRYHNLLAEALQNELKNRYSKEEIKLIMNEAANILYSKGYFVPSIELLLKNQNYLLASTWITTKLVDIFTLGQISMLIGWVQTMRKSNFSVPYEILVMDTIALISTLQYEEAAELMMELEMKQQLEQWMEHEENLGIASIYETVKAYAIVATGGDINQAREIIENQLEKGRVSSRWDTISIQYNTFEHKISRTSIGSKGKIQLSDEAIAFSNLMKESEFNEQNMTAYGYGVSAETMYEVNLIEQASESLEIALEYGLGHKDPGLFVPMYLLKAQMHLKNQNFLSAHMLLSNAIGIVQEKHWIHTLQTMMAKCYLLEGDLLQAEQELTKSEAKHPFWMLVNARFLIAKSKAEDALKLILHVKTKALQEMQISTIIEAFILEAICEKTLGNKESSIMSIHEALKHGETYKYIRTFLDEKDCKSILKDYLTMRQTTKDINLEKVSLAYVNFLLENFDSSSNEFDAQFDALTPREMEIYSLLVKGATNKEIANELYLSEGTVRVYLTNIYSKLGVKSRAKAILLVK